MHTHLIPVIVLLVLPALYFGHRLGVWADRRWRWVAGAVLVAAVLVSLPYQGVDFAHLKHMKLILAAATALLLVAYRLGPAWRPGGTRFRVALGALAALSLVVYLNFFAFHGSGGVRAFVHLHDVAHNYLGAKYYAELRHADLYTAMLRAESETQGDRFSVLEARDLGLYRSITDNGAGGLSSSVGEMATLSGGAEIHLDRVQRLADCRSS